MQKYCEDLPLRGGQGDEVHWGDRVADDEERVDRAGEGGGKVRDGGDGDVGREEQSRQLRARKGAWMEESEFDMEMQLMITHDLKKGTAGHH